MVAAIAPAPQVQQERTRPLRTSTQSSGGMPTLAAPAPPHWGLGKLRVASRLAESVLEQGLDSFGVGLSFAPFHYLADKEGHQFDFAFSKALDFARMGGEDFVDPLAERALIADLD